LPALNCDRAQPRRAAVATLLSLGLVSGGITLAYEVVWTRILLNLLGSTTTASAIILATFMAGIALGAWLGGRWTDGLGRPLRLYAAAEALLALAGVAAPGLLNAAAGASPAGGVALALVALVLIVPAVLMGVALPALAAALQHRGALDAKFVSRLYGINTLGGMAAALAIGFALLPLFGLAATTRGIAAVGLAVAAMAAALDARRAAADKTVPGPAPARREDGVRPALLVPALVLAGIAALGYEVVWTRILVLVVGSSTNAFTLMLGLYLAGVAIGGLLIARVIGRLRHPAAVFQRLQIGIAGAALAGLFLFGYLPGMALTGFAWLGTSGWSIAAVNGLIGAVVIVVPTIMIGASLPLAMRMLEGARPRRGFEFGTALALVTAGNTLGVLGTAFAVIPAFGLQGGVALLATVNLAAALVIAPACRATPPGRQGTVAAIAISLVLVAALMPGWDRAVMTSGVFRQAPVYLAMLGSAARLEQAFSVYRSLFYREGSEAVVAVFERPTLDGRRHRVLTIDGKVDASTGADMATQLLSGHLPSLFSPQARSALVIGLASGVTVGALARHPFRRIDVVEIEPAVIAASRSFLGESGDPLADPRVAVTISDGRRYLRNAGRRYDVIVSEPSNPWLSMSARLFTREFFTLAKSRLTAGGMLVQWVPLYGLSPDQFRALLRTISGVFPRISLFRVAAGDLVVVASAEPVLPSAQALDALFEGMTGAALDRVGVNGPADLLARWMADDEGLRTTIGAGPVNTDDNGLLEFGSPWYLLSDTIPANLALIRAAGRASDIPRRLVAQWGSLPDGPALLQAVAARYRADGRIALMRALAAALGAAGWVAEADLIRADAAVTEGRWSEAAAMLARYASPPALIRRATIAFRTGDMAAARRLFSRLDARALRAEGGVMQALALAAGGAEEAALAVLARVPQAGTAGADAAGAIIAPFLRGWLLERRDTPQAAAGAEAARARWRGRLDGLRRCMEADGCRATFTALVAWSGAAPPGVTERIWERLRQTIYVRVTRPLPLYLRGVSALWLGEKAQARQVLRSYLRLLPAPDPLSKAHAMLRQAGAGAGDGDQANSVTGSAIPRSPTAPSGVSPSPPKRSTNAPVNR
jgi:spermidine synthase